MHISSLDGLRGFALILIMLYHTFQPYTYGGFIGVDIFFVLSGLLITTLLLKEYNTHQSINFKFFYVRRILRLAPALIIMVSTFYIYGQFFFTEEQNTEAFAATLSTLFYTANIAKAYDWYPMGYLLPTWSLSIEEQFYFAWPIVFVLLFNNLKNQHKLILSISALIVVLWLNRIFLTLDSNTTIDRLYFGSDTHSDGLLIGCLTATLLFYYEQSSSKIIIFLRNRSTLITITCLAFFGLSFLFLGRDIRSLYIWYFPILSIISAILISSLYLQKNDKANILFSNKALVWLGSISYGVYLWHWPVYRVISEMGNKGFQMGLYGSLIAIAIASFSFYFIEKPILKLKRHFH